MKFSFCFWICLAMLFVWAGSASVQSQVVINEFMASNTKTLADQDGDYSDWIEIYNSGASPVNLADWYLTDSESQLNKWKFPSVSLAANGYLVVFASGKNRAVAGAQLHANFSLAAQGEYLALVQPDGATVASEFAPQYPEQFDDISYGIGANGETFFAQPTPGASNSGGFPGFVSDVKFSHERGFYDAPFNLSLLTQTPAANIYFTTNGTVPSATNGFVYAGPIVINGTTVLRAAANKNSYQPSRVDTQTYIFLDDVIHQSTNGAPPPGWPGSWGSNTRDYGMDPDVVNSPRYRGTIKNDLKTIPSFSLVMNLNDLFNASTGIYANASSDGPAWERPASIELFYPDDRKGFQINAGIRIRGGYSRSTGNPKHAFRFFFRSKYGDAKLHFPMFASQDGVDTFDGFDFRTFQNYSWSFEGDSRGIFLRDQFSRDTQFDMGQPCERGDYYHLYIDGQYWGLYNTAERSEAAYGASYFGGNKEEYDTIKVNPAAGYTIFATDGSLAAWTRAWNQAKAGLTNDAACQKILGNNPDGTRNPAYEVLLDADNLIDYMLVIFYGGNLDAPVSNFLGNTSPNNFFGVRNTNGLAGFRFFAHDSEHTLLDVNQNRTGPYSAGDVLNKSNPQWFFQKLIANAEFRLRVADRIHKHFFNGGTLTPEACTARFLKRKAEIDRAVVGESARWGDSKRATPLTRDVEWIAEINRVLNNYIPQRTGIVLNQIRAKNWYPTVAAPEFNQHGGNITSGFNLVITGTNGTIYYTVDGTDPRLYGGAVSPGAKIYGSPLTLVHSVEVNARALTGTNWSALNSARFNVVRTFTNLLITEIMYHPPALGAVDGDAFEFIELKNTAAASLDLSGVYFSEGIQYTFPDGTVLGPGQFVVLVNNLPAFAGKYPGVGVNGGVYAGSLANGGETLTLADASGTTITSIAYNNKYPWPTTADEIGFSLVPVNPNSNPDPNDPANWRASAKIGGSPGADDPASAIPAILVNEVLTHTDLPQKDAIELYNANPTNVDIGGWYLTDDRKAPKKFRVPAGTAIPANGYVVFTEDEFNAKPGVEPNFSLSSQGEEVFLYSGDATGNLTGYSHGFSFGAAQNGVTFGRYLISTGEAHYPAQLANTLGAPNAGPRVGPVVINEIYYHPAPSEDEFVELKNISPDPVKFYDPANPTNTWKLGGLDFDFPPNVELASNGLLLLVAIEPSAFRAQYGVPASVPVLGPYFGALQHGGETLQLKRPDTPEPGTNVVASVPYILVDEVKYNDKSPWPTNSDGGGSSLQRINPAAYGNDPANWSDSVGPPSPGLAGNGNRAPRIGAGNDQQIQSTLFPLAVNLQGTVSDDGLPNPPGALTTSWSQVSGPGAVVFLDSAQLNTTATFPGVGAYVLRLTASDGQLQNSDDVTIVIDRPSAQATFVVSGAIWKYLDDGSDQGTAWRGTNFDDSSWMSGPALLGYGDANGTLPATTVGYGPDPNNKFVTTYFRRTFAVTNASTVSALTLRLVRDDGAVVYLNGTEVFRSNMPEGEITTNTLASSVVGSADEITFFETTVDPARLVEGSNLLAVEIHQANLSSSDISFDLELTGTTQVANQAPKVSAGNDQTVTLPASITLNGSVFDDGLPIPPGNLGVAWSKVSGPGNVTFGNVKAAATTANFTAAGVYLLRLTANDGVLIASDDISVTVADGGLASLQFESIKLVHGSPNVVLFRFIAQAGKSYTVQHRDSLSDGTWLKLKDVAAPFSDQPIDVPELVPDGQTSRFYRIVTPEQP